MKVFILLKARLSSSLLTKTYLKDLKARDRIWLLPLAAAGIFSGVLFFMIMLIQNYKALLSIGINIGEPELIFLFSAIISSVLLFFVSTPLCMSNIFYSKDSMLTAYLPVSTAEIVFSRVLSVYLFILPIHLLILLPAVFLFFPSNGSAAALVNTFIFSITGPALPLIASLAAASLLAAAGDKTGYHTTFEIIGMIFAIFIAGALQISISRSIINSGDFAAVAETLSGYTVILKKICFAASWTAGGFAPGGWFSIAVSLIFSAVVVFLSLLILKKVRLNLTTRPTNPRTDRKSWKKKDAYKLSNIPHSVTSALIKREWAIVKSNSTFLMETISEVLILPILLGITYFTVPQEISAMLNEFTSSFKALPLVIIAILILTGAINSISSTSLSREGSTFLLSKQLPLKGRNHIKAKLIFHMMLFLTSWYLNLITIVILLRLPLIHLLYLIPAGPAIVILEFAVLIHVDLSRPLLNWSHPQQAMKQNMNVLIGMGFGILVFAGLMLPAAGLYYAGINSLFIGLFITAEAAIMDLLLIPRILEYSDRRYIEISV